MQFTLDELVTRAETPLGRRLLDALLAALMRDWDLDIHAPNSWTITDPQGHRCRVRDGIVEQGPAPWEFETPLSYCESLDACRTIEVTLSPLQQRRYPKVLTKFLERAEPDRTIAVFDLCTASPVARTICLILTVQGGALSRALATQA